MSLEGILSAVHGAESVTSASRGGDTLADGRGGVLLLTSSLLDDRKLLYSEVIQQLQASADVTIWASSVLTEGARVQWTRSGAPVEPLPAVNGYPEVPHNWLRRFNEFVWDFHLPAPSCQSMWRHIRGPRAPYSVRVVRPIARFVSHLQIHSVLERTVQRLLARRCCSPGAEARLRAMQPAVVVVTGPNRFEEPAIANEARRLGIPVIAAIHSWDNLSVKSRMAVDYDAYLVWSEQMKDELAFFCPQSRQKPVYIIGAVQFDTFFQPRFFQTRAEFCSSYGLRHDLPMIVYALGSPNIVREHPGVVVLASRIAKGELGDVQLLVRPHPQCYDGTETRELEAFGSRVVVQHTGQANEKRPSRYQNEAHIIDWVNTFRHADVVVNLSSTATVDAAIFDRPVVNLDFDPSPGQPQQAMVKEINHLWTHFRPLAESGGVWLAKDMDSVVTGIKGYLADPALHREKRRWIAEYVCGYLDGGCGQRMAEAILDFADRRRVWRLREPLMVGPNVHDRTR